jgi:hypothetical protein
MVQVPMARSVTVAFNTVQTEVVWEVKLTGNPDDAVALTANVPAAMASLESVSNVIVWLSGVTVKLWLTDGAAE